MLKPNGIDKLHLRLADDLVKGNLSVNKYIVQRGLTSRVTLNEVIYLVNNPINYNLFLYSLTIGGRCLAMKQILELTNRQIAEVAYFSKTTIGDFISGNIDLELDSKAIQTRDFSILLIYRLAIILDIPIRYLANNRVSYKLDTIFDEYEVAEIEKINFMELVDLATSFVNDGLSNRQRKIMGVKTLNEFFEYEDKYLYTRVDIREKWFTIEVHILNQSSINFVEINKLREHLDEECHVFIGDSFLRANKKINIVIPVKNDINEILLRSSYLGKALW